MEQLLTKMQQDEFERSTVWTRLKQIEKAQEYITDEHDKQMLEFEHFILSYRLKRLLQQYNESHKKLIERRMHA